MGTLACTNSCAPAARVMHAHIHHVSYTLRIAAHAPPRARAHLVLLIDDAVEGAVNVAVGEGAAAAAAIPNQGFRFCPSAGLPSSSESPVTF